MEVMNIFHTNWLDFLTWTLAGCMVLALMVHLAELWRPTELLRKTEDVVQWPQSHRKAS